LSMRRPSLPVAFVDLKTLPQRYFAKIDSPRPPAPLAVEVAICCRVAHAWWSPSSAARAYVLRARNHAWPWPMNVEWCFSSEVLLPTGGERRPAEGATSACTSPNRLPPTGPEEGPSLRVFMAAFSSGRAASGSGWIAAPFPSAQAFAHARHFAVAPFFHWFLENPWLVKG
jgi:hypothetical protein